MPSTAVRPSSVMMASRPPRKLLEGAGNAGFDAARNRYVNLFEAGVVDPTKVVRVALENAVSVTSILPLTEATMTEKPEPKKAAPAAKMGL